MLQVHSVCPSIYGHELVKASLLLGLFGGCQRYAGSGTHVPIRGDPHILVVGDPGLGKSQVSGCYCSDAYSLLRCVNALFIDVFLEGLPSWLLGIWYFSFDLLIDLNNKLCLHYLSAFLCPPMTDMGNLKSASCEKLHLSIDSLPLKILCCICLRIQLTSYSLHEVLMAPTF